MQLELDVGDIRLGLEGNVVTKREAMLGDAVTSTSASMTDILLFCILVELREIRAAAQDKSHSTPARF